MKRFVRSEVAQTDASYRCPPEAVMRSPVSHEDWSEARNSATRAISSGLPSRPIGSAAPIVVAVSPSIPNAARPSVAVMPGAIALTRILRLASSLASALVIVSTALFDAE